jgi:hypothetical protein
MMQDGSHGRLPSLFSSLHARRKFNGNGKETVLVGVLLDLEHELTGYPFLNAKLLQTDGDIFGVNIGTEIGNREISTLEDINEGQLPNAALSYGVEYHQRIELPIG